MIQETCELRSKEEELLETLEERLGRVYAQQRLDMERDYEERFNGGVNFFNPDKWYSVHSIITRALKLTGLYRLGARNTERLQVRHNCVELQELPTGFDGFTILHLSDLHADMNQAAVERMAELAVTLEYDICVVTGDFRGKAYGPFDAALRAMLRARPQLGESESVYGVLGNHDSVRMLPELEAMGIRMLVNESETIMRGNQRIHLAGVDDANYYAAANVEKAASGIPRGEFSILLSHTPEIYKQAAEAGFHLCLSGHTHGGQICLPGSIPVTLSCDLPRRMGAGPWSYHTMAGYTSVGVGSSIIPVRFNCPPEITLHHLQCA